MTREQIIGLTEKTLLPQAKVGKLSTVDFILSQVGGKRTLDMAKARLLKELDSREEQRS